jgi:hypothetical protein
VPQPESSVEDGVDNNYRYNDVDDDGDSMHLIAGDDLMRKSHRYAYDVIL